MSLSISKVTSFSSEGDIYLLGWMPMLPTTDFDDGKTSGRLRCSTIFSKSDLVISAVTTLPLVLGKYITFLFEVTVRLCVFMKLSTSESFPLKIIGILAFGG